MRKSLRFQICTYFTLHLQLGIKSFSWARPPVNSLRAGHKEGGDVRMTDLCHLLQWFVCVAGGPGRLLMTPVLSGRAGGSEQAAVSSLSPAPCTLHLPPGVRNEQMLGGLHFNHLFPSIFWPQWLFFQSAAIESFLACLVKHGRTMRTSWGNV